MANNTKKLGLKSLIIIKGCWTKHGTNVGKVLAPQTSSLFSPLVQPLRRTAAWSRCQKAPVQTMFCCGTSTLAHGNAGRLCTAAVGATRTASPRGRSARGGVGWKGVMEGTNQVVNKIGKVIKKSFLLCSINGRTLLKHKSVKKVSFVSLYYRQ